MKAILRSINNFSCKLKQSNNLKYNISPKIRSNKFKSISGNGNVTIEDALNKDLKDYKVYGNTYQNSTTGKNLYNQIINTKQYGLTIVGDKDKIAINGEQTSVDQKIELGSAILPPGTYTIMIEDLNGMSNLSGWIYIKNTCNRPTSTTLYVNSTTSKKSVTFTLTQANTITYGIYLVTYRPTYNSLIRLSLVSGSTEDYDFEPYTGGQPSPNPDYPQEIISCGDRTKNLLNVSNEYSVTTWQEIDVNLQPGDYIVNCTNTSTNVESGNTSLMIFYHSDNTYDQLYFSRVDKVGTVTITAETTKVRIYSGSSYAVSNGKTTILTNQMLRKSNISDGTYEPYGKYKIPVNVRSDNLCNGNLTQGQYRNGVYHSDINRFTTDFMKVEPNTKYTFSLNSIDNLASLINLAFFDENQNFLGARSDMGLDTFANTDREKTITTTNETYYLRWTLRPYGSKTTLSYPEAVTQKLQFEKGNKTSYKPYYNETTNIYLDEPLRKIDGYSDYVDFINGKVVRQLGEVILDENSTLSVIEIITSNNKFIWRYTTALDIIGSGARSNILSNNYIGDTTVYGANNKIGAYVNSNGITNFATLLSTVGATTNSTITQVLNLLKTWLSLHHTELIYPLATTIEEDIELPNIKLIESKNIITIGTEVQGVFEAEYYSKEIIDISNYKYNLRKVED